VDYEQSQEINYRYDGSYNLCDLERLSRCPEWVQEAVGYEERQQEYNDRYGKRYINNAIKQSAQYESFIYTSETFVCSSSVKCWSI
jgi:hypothetical protein